MSPSLPAYFGVITARDYIKIKGRRVPFWHFLDRMPDGWLTSLAYKRTDMPTDRQQLWDCGAWSYKKKEQPELGGERVTPSWALKQYAELAAPGSFVIAPDHILVKGADLDARRQFNATSARDFLAPARAAGFRPMAAIHGMDGAERIDHVRRLLDLGYEALAVGGVAARASQPKMVLEMVHALREETEGTWLHVLGLSAPSYMSEWQRLGVDACDGSSHFKQAFTAGAYYVHDTGTLVRMDAARFDHDTGELTTAIPDHECSCKACRTLRAEGVDTRTFRSNENNMGRAAHNLNMLLRAHDYIARPTVHLVSCASGKAADPAPAAELYRSEWFTKARRYVESEQTPWFILSAQHGLVPPDQVLAPYELSLNEQSGADREAWARNVAASLTSRHQEPTRFIVLAGRAYRQHLQPLLESAGHAVEVPMEGLGIGQQLSWLNEKVATQLKLFESVEG